MASITATCESTMLDANAQLDETNSIDVHELNEKLLALLPDDIVLEIKRVIFIGHGSENQNDQAKFKWLKEQTKLFADNKLKSKTMRAYAELKAFRVLVVMTYILKHEDICERATDMMITWREFKEYLFAMTMAGTDIFHNRKKTL